METYTYSVSSDFSNNYDPGIFSNSIKTSSIGAKYKGGRKKGDVVTVRFNPGLTAPEIIILDNIVSSHDPDEITSLSNNLNKLDATTDPTADDDESRGYAVGSTWHNIVTNEVCLCIDATDGAAVWTCRDSDIEVFSGSDTLGGLTLTSGFQDLPLNVEHKKTINITHTGSSAEVTINKTGTYVITGYASVLTTVGSNSAAAVRLARNTGSGYSAIVGTLVNMPIDQLTDDDRATGTFSVTLDVTSGDQFKLEIQYINIDPGGSIATTPCSGLNIHRIGAGAPGAVGPAGPPGAGSTVVLQDEGSNVTNTPHSVLNFVGDGVTTTDAGSGVATITIPSGAIFGSEYGYDSSAPEFSTSSSGFVQAFTTTTASLPAGDYRINWYYNWRQSNSQDDFLCRLQIDNSTTIHEHRQEPKDASSDQRHVVCGFINTTLTSGTHTIDIDIAAPIGNTSYIRNMRIEWWRVA